MFKLPSFDILTRRRTRQEGDADGDNANETTGGLLTYDSSAVNNDTTPHLKPQQQQPNHQHDDTVRNAVVKSKSHENIGLHVTAPDGISVASSVHMVPQVISSTGTAVDNVNVNVHLNV